MKRRHLPQSITPCQTTCTLSNPSPRGPGRCRLQWGRGGGGGRGRRGGGGAGGQRVRDAGGGGGGGGAGRARTRGGSARRHRFRDAGRLGCFPYNSASVKAISILVASEPPPRRSGDPSRSQAAAQPTQSPVFHRVPCLSADTLARTDLVSPCAPESSAFFPGSRKLGQERPSPRSLPPPPTLPRPTPALPPPPSFPAEPQFSLPPRPLPPPAGLPFSEALSNFRLFQQWMVV